MELQQQALKAQRGQLAFNHYGVELPLSVISIPHGFCIGTEDLEGPCSIESAETYETKEDAVFALSNGTWTQRTLN